MKICGITDRRALEAAVESGADAVGVVFSESPRRVTPWRAAALLEQGPPLAARVAVFRHPDEVTLHEALSACRFDCVQAEADSGPALARVSHTPFLPVFHDGIGLADDVSTWVLSQQPQPGMVLVDGAVSGAGRSADWVRVAGICRRFRVVLAGGLTPDNVGAAIQRVGPHGVDVSSGVETAPGVKDPLRISAFLEAVRAAETRNLKEDYR